MKRIKIYLLMLLAALTVGSCGSDNDGPGGGIVNTNTNANVVTPGMPDEITRLEFPKVKGGTSTVIVHETDQYGVNFCTEFDTSKKSQRWSCYAVYKSNNLKGWNRNDWKTALSQLEKEISLKNEIVAKALLHIYKNVQLIKAEMEVYDIMNSDTASLNIIEHPIRKVVDLSVQSFFLDLLDRNINIKHGLSTDKVLIDFPTFSVVLGHILDNVVKYASSNSTLNISFESSKETVKILFAMNSILVEQEELDRIFLEKYSGHWVTEFELQGHGIGMYYAKRLIELNNGSIVFKAGKEKYKYDGIPYADNTIEITLQKAQQ